MQVAQVIRIYQTLGHKLIRVLESPCWRIFTVFLTLLGMLPPQDYSLVPESRWFTMCVVSSQSGKKAPSC